VAPSNATNKTVSWSSSNTAIATVSTGGLVTAVAAGTATITVTTQDGSKTATCAVTVTTVAVTGVTLSPTSTSLSVGATQQLTATIAPTNATNKSVTWSSSNTAIATVSTAGLVTAVAAGTATITVKTTDGSKTATCAVTVTATSGFTVYFYRPSTWGTGIKIYWWSALPAGNLADGTWPGVSMTNTGGNWYSYTFTNITSTNVIFDDGTNQTANLSRSSNGWYYNGNWYNTQPVPVTGVTVSPLTATLAPGATKQLTATLVPSNATVTGVAWSSDNTSVATVSSSGLVTAVGAGTAAITATTTDNSFTANCTVTVTASGTATYYNIINRWQANTYLYDGGNGQVKYGTSPSGNNNYLWEQVAGPTGYVYLVNLGTGNMMHVEDQNGAIEAGIGNPVWYSAQWSVVSTGDGWNYLENRWQTSDWINIQNLAGYAQYSGAAAGFYSAEWQFVTPTVINYAAFKPGISGETSPAATNGLSGSLSGEPLVHPALSPNGDGMNDVLTIDNISRYPENRIMVMSVSGVKVFESANYDNVNKTFNGHSSINGAMVPKGTYFYMLEYRAGNTLKRKTGYIILKY
jgi:gliding motility-associated-like protein